MYTDKQLLIPESSIRYSNAKKQLKDNAKGSARSTFRTDRLAKLLQILFAFLLLTGFLFVFVPIAFDVVFPERFDEIDYAPENCCINIETAKNCGSISSCIVEWEMEAAASDPEPEICKECIRMVEMARDQLDSNMTRDELAEVFRGVCKIYFLNIKPLVEQCDKLVDKYLDEYLEMLISAMDPEMICRTALLCPNVYSFTGGCSMCRQYSNRTLTAIDSKPKSENLKNFDRFLTKTCLASIDNRTICSAIRTAQMNAKIFDDVRNGLRTNAFCEIGALCYVNNHRHSQLGAYDASLAANDLDDQSETCQSCRVLVDSVRQSLVRETSQLEFRLIAEKVCVHLYEKPELCKHYSHSTLFDQIFFALNQSDFAQKLCVNSRQCKRREIQFGDAIRDVDDHGPVNLPLDRVLLVREGSLPLAEYVGLRPSRRHRLPFARNNNKDCVMCLLFIESIRNYLEQNKTVDQIYRYMQDVCKTFDLQLQSDCFAFVNTYGKRITAKLFQNIHPNEICLDFDFCA